MKNAIAIITAATAAATAAAIIRVLFPSLFDDPIFTPPTSVCDSLKELVGLRGSDPVNGLL